MRAPHAAGRADALLALLAAVCLWGVAPVSTRYLVGYLDPLSLLALRFGISALALAPVLVVVRPARPLSRNDRLLLIGAGLVGIVGYNVPVAYGLRWTPAGVAGVLIATEPIWIVIIATLWLREEVTPGIWIGLILSAAGVANLVLIGAARPIEASGAQFIAGAALVLLGAIMWASYTVMMRVLSRRYGALRSAAVTTIVGAAPLMALAWAQKPLPASVAQLESAGWAVLLLVSLGSTVVATTCWNYGLGHVKSAQAGLFLYLVPLISLAGGALFLGETIRPGVVLSCALIVGGVAISQIWQLARPARADA